MRDLLNRYQARVTFYVTQFDSLSAEEIQMLRDLQKDGHEIASHGALHVQAEAYIKDHSYKEYLANEVDNSIASMNKAGFHLTSFAYPYGSKYWFTDYLLLKRFQSTRGVASSGGKPVEQLDDVFYDFDGNRKLVSIEIDGVTPLTKEKLIPAFDRLATNNEVLMLSAHEPTKLANPQTYFFNSDTLEAILREAHKRQFHFYRVSDLKSDQ